MVCLEFDVQDLPIGLDAAKKAAEQDEHVKMNRKFRVINQDFINQNLCFRINGTCHGQKVFAENSNSLSFSLSGKKVIKSIQDRILKLKTLLKNHIVKAYPRLQAPVQVIYD